MPLTILCSPTVDLEKGRAMIRHKNIQDTDVILLTRDKGDENAAGNYGQVYWDNRGLGWMSLRSSNPLDTGRIRWTLIR